MEQWEIVEEVTKLVGNAIKRRNAQPYTNERAGENCKLEIEYILSDFGCTLTYNKPVPPFTITCN